jgi:hypothetical protein
LLFLPWIGHIRRHSTVNLHGTNGPDEQSRDENQRETPHLPKIKTAFRKMGFFGLLVLLHIVTGLFGLMGIGYVYVLPRIEGRREKKKQKKKKKKCHSVFITVVVLLRDVKTNVGFGGISHNSAIISFYIAPPASGIPCPKPPCPGLWVKVLYTPVDPTEEEKAEMEKNKDDKRFDSGFFQTSHEDFYNVQVPLINLRSDTEYEFVAMVYYSNNNIRGEVFRQRFKTLPLPGPAQNETFSFVFGSCLMSRSQPFSAVSLIDPQGPVMSLEPKPRFAMLVGDSVYLGIMSFFQILFFSYSFLRCSMELDVQSSGGV